MTWMIEIGYPASYLTRPYGGPPLKFEHLWIALERARRIPDARVVREHQKQVKQQFLTPEQREKIRLQMRARMTTEHARLLRSKRKDQPFNGPCPQIR